MLVSGGGQVVLVSENFRESNRIIFLTSDGWSGGVTSEAFHVCFMCGSKEGEKIFENRTP